MVNFIQTVLGFGRSFHPRDVRGRATTRVRRPYRLNSSPALASGRAPPPPPAAPPFPALRASPPPFPLSHRPHRRRSHSSHRSSPPHRAPPPSSPRPLSPPLSLSPFSSASRPPPRSRSVSTAVVAARLPGSRPRRRPPAAGRAARALGRRRAVRPLSTHRDLVSRYSRAAS